MRSLVVIVGFVLSLHGALAADPVFLPGSRIGLVPPDGMTSSKRAWSFEHQGKGAVMWIEEMPANQEERDDLGRSLSLEGLKQLGMEQKSREILSLASGPALLIAGTTAEGRVWILSTEKDGISSVVKVILRGSEGGYSASEIRSALTTVAFRDPVPLEEQLDILPFRIGDRAGFRPIWVLPPASSAQFTDGPLDDRRAIDQPTLFVMLPRESPPAPGEAAEKFARASLKHVAGAKNITVESSQAFRLKGQNWHEIVARATHSFSGRPIILIQTIRIEGNRYLKMVGLTLADQRDRNLPRFRTIIDSVEMNP